jgi:DNA modification methylase
MIEVLIHGDCLDEMKKMADNSVDFAFTSPIIKKMFSILLGNTAMQYRK